MKISQKIKNQKSVDKLKSTASQRKADIARLAANNDGKKSANFSSNPIHKSLVAIATGQKTTDLPANFLFLGCGKMGGAILERLDLDQEFKQRWSLTRIAFSVIKPSGLGDKGGSDISKFSKVKFFKNTDELPQNYRADIVFLCIKPQESEKILVKFAKDAAKAKIFHKKTIFISILAGKNCEFFKAIFGDKAKIMRLMPNLPVISGDGIIPYFFGGKFSSSEKNFLKAIFANLGESFEVGDEENFHEITAIFGCGPAYIFLLQEVFFKIAKDLKIDQKLAEKLVKQLFLGSAKLSIEGTSCPKIADDFSSLVKSVASKGGATEAALEVLNDSSGLESLFRAAIAKAAERSKFLSKN